MQLQYDGQGDYIKTTTVFPYFVDSNDFIRNVMEHGMNMSLKALSVEKCGERIADAIVKELDIVTLPSFFYYIAYLM